MGFETKIYAWTSLRGGYASFVAKKDLAVFAIQKTIGSACVWLHFSTQRRDEEIFFTAYLVKTKQKKYGVWIMRG